MNLIGVPEERITVIPWGVDHEIFYEEKDKSAIREKLRCKLGLKTNYFLSVSCDAGRKRTDKLIEAYLKIDKPCNDLVLVWSNAPEKIRKGIEGIPRIHLLENIDNETLRELYNCATAAVNPTAYEGFGLPILEAMACGCVSVTCRNSSLPEVGGEVAIYVDEPIEDNLGIMLQRIDKKELDVSVRQRDGIVWAGKFSWERAARQTADVYRNLMKVCLSRW
jgi:glycosyltransferase involved in cell wall biosynthesis